MQVLEDRARFPACVPRRDQQHIGLGDRQRIGSGLGDGRFRNRLMFEQDAFSSKG
jgi:hypothetical protein